jgi:hypothetical protein
MVISPSVLLRMRGVSDKNVQIIKIDILCPKTFFENIVAYKIM